MSCLQPLLAICLLDTVRQLAVLTNGQLILLGIESLEGEAFLGVKVRLSDIYFCLLYQGKLHQHSGSIFIVIQS